MKLKNIQLDKDKLFFTSDTHFFHKNIIKYCNRPFNNVEEMNQTLIDNWNKVVPKDAIIFHIGDFALTSPNSGVENIISKLNGNIYLVIGNHEKDAIQKEKNRNLFKGIFDIVEIFVNDDEVSYEKQHLVLCHYPMLVWNASHRGSWNLFGHVHGGLNDKNLLKNTQLDVGVDCNNFTPISYQKVKEIITLNAMTK